jgi:hypothetical protein
MRTLTLLVMLAAVAASSGCGLHAMTLPADFVAVEPYDRGPYEVRGVSADAVVLALRRETNPEHGSLDFWTQAIGRQMTERRGYQATGSEAVTSVGGAAGRLLSFTEERQGVLYTYRVAVYVQGSDILVAEAGGKAGAVAAHQEEIRKALLSVR